MSEGVRVGKREEVEHLEKRAGEFMRTAEYQAGEGMYALAIFSLEQALQLFLKSRLILHGVDYPRTHSIRRLLEMLSSILGERGSWVKSLLRDRALEISFLEDAYISSRYLLREFGEEEYRRVREVVEEVMRNLR
ncbi:MAG: HEPN domain-containing protein [Candidatus Bathyarchaeia archaeon]